MKVFLLENDASIAMGLEYSLQKEGYETALSTCVKDALDRIAREEFDLYLFDLSLPDGSGYEVCRAIKEKGDYPVIFLAALEYRLFLITLNNRGMVPRNQLLENIWDINGIFVNDNTLTV